MARPRIPDAIRRVFMETFNARDIAEPLPSFDTDSSCATVRNFMQATGADVVGIRTDGRIAGYVESGWLQEGACGQYQQGFAEAIVLEDTAPLLRVLTGLGQAPFGFVTVFGEVCGIITRGNLQKPPVRMWLFGVVTLIEMRCSELIERHCPSESWTRFLSEARLQKARVLLDERRRRNQSLGLLDCLQFSDKGQIIARNEEIRGLTVFRSRRQAEQAVKELEQLRNNLAHAQDFVAADWATIVQLCDFIVDTDRGWGNPPDERAR
jgi:hypothetical protein